MCYTGCNATSTFFHHEFLGRPQSLSSSTSENLWLISILDSNQRSQPEQEVRFWHNCHLLGAQQFHAGVRRWNDLQARSHSWPLYQPDRHLPPSESISPHAMILRWHHCSLTECEWDCEDGVCRYSTHALKGSSCLWWWFLCLIETIIGEIFMLNVGTNHVTWFSCVTSVLVSNTMTLSKTNLARWDILIRYQSYSISRFSLLFSIILY